MWPSQTSVDSHTETNICVQCRGEFVARLLEAGADGTVKNDSDHTPFELVRCGAVRGTHVIWIIHRREHA